MTILFRIYLYSHLKCKFKDAHKGKIMYNALFLFSLLLLFYFCIIFNKYILKASHFSWVVAPSTVPIECGMLGHMSTIALIYTSPVITPKCTRVLSSTRDPQTLLESVPVIYKSFVTFGNDLLEPVRQ